nr:hypothetical protein CFP56_28882 [Quercus suber]
MKAVQDDKIRNPRPLFPILQLKTGKYADEMCCVQLGSMLYFLGGENLDIDDPYIDEDVKKELAVRDLFPKDVYCFERTVMNCGKASPLAFVADEKIYVIGSSRWDSDENFAYFEMFDPKVDNWIILPNPPPLIRNVNTIWVGHVVVGRKALITALLPHETERLYCFDLDTHKWANTTIPDYLEEMGMDAIRNVPPQVQYSASLLHLGKMHFCYVRTGMPPHPDLNFGNGFVTGNDKKRFISILIPPSQMEVSSKAAMFLARNFHFSLEGNALKTIELTYQLAHDL